MSVIAIDVLQEQIDAKRKEIHSDQYAISVGELANMYKDEELDIHPEFQRFFRWTPEQKSRFVESILLGIPIPSLFVAQRADGKWDVIDGLQRLSTLFQMMGILKDADGQSVEPLTLTRTKYLPAMEGRRWSGLEEEGSFTAAQQLLIKRSKLDIKIILRESDESAKFELFQRLNTGGAPLSDQEIRNAMLVAANKPFYDWLNELAQYPAFKDTVLLSERQKDERYDVELVLRFVVLRRMDDTDLRSIGDIGEFLTDRMMELSLRFASLRTKEAKAFRRTFDALANSVMSDAFRRYDTERQRFTGGFLISAFEAVALGLGFQMPDQEPHLSAEDLKKKIREIWSNPGFGESTGSGVRASQRIPAVLALGRELFAS
jgi:hypothetical protein